MMAERRSILVVIVVLVGLPAAGKTIVAQRLAEAHQALRFTPDGWMIPDFGC